MISVDKHGFSGEREREEGRMRLASNSITLFNFLLDKKGNQQ